MSIAPHFLLSPRARQNGDKRQSERPCKDDDNSVDFLVRRLPRSSLIKFSHVALFKVGGTIRERAPDDSYAPFYRSSTMRLVTRGPLRTAAGDSGGRQRYWSLKPRLRQSHNPSDAALCYSQAADRPAKLNGIGLACAEPAASIRRYGQIIAAPGDAPFLRIVHGGISWMS